MKTVKLTKQRSRTKAPKEFAPRKILVPVDFSALSGEALERARQIALQYDSKIHLLHVLEPILHPVEYAIIPGEMQDINAQLTVEGKTRLEVMKNVLEQAGIVCAFDVKLGKPARVIADFAKTAKCDLIVIATHGNSGPKHFFLGSTAERVVQHAPCSVLVVR